MPVVGLKNHLSPFPSSRTSSQSLSAFLSICMFLCAPTDSYLLVRSLAPSQTNSQDWCLPESFLEQGHIDDVLSVLDITARLAMQRYLSVHIIRYNYMCGVSRSSSRQRLGCGNGSIILELTLSHSLLAATSDCWRSCLTSVSCCLTASLSNLAFSFSKAVSRTS